MLQIMAKHFPNGDMDFITQPTSYDYGLDASWEDWVFEESRRRSVFYLPCSMT